MALAGLLALAQGRLSLLLSPRSRGIPLSPPVSNPAGVIRAGLPVQVSCVVGSGALSWAGGQAALGRTRRVLGNPLLAAEVRVLHGQTDKGPGVYVARLNFSKACDFVPPDALIKKLH